MIYGIYAEGKKSDQEMTRSVEVGGKNFFLIFAIDMRLHAP